ncbi:bacterial lipid A biosynthesis acyltransferase family protein [Collimonas arenae]|uniref:Bacterial lipid A biosynthesis acyltransferase family protein n=1 Tax=Collimonas arenae TaxID=279058 RepID=A0A127QJL0_9BURK|nr:acyltransferase [Collimonas arenae]AMP00373.1 bacterial lipid A biosynthesis acyltransferase family protein [Collimonas arenae]AMP10251.1 bacterial lipid A biosynthesis acyltransferase family protein [Collimonas arenae]
MSAGKLHWAQINEASFVVGMRLLFWIYRIAGRWPFRIALYPVLGWYLLSKPAARQASQKYLQRLQAYDPAAARKNRIQPGLPGVFQHFGAFAENILDKMLLWGGLFKTADVVSYGREQMLENIEARRGGLLICAHLGNLELCRVLSRQRSALRITVLVHTKHAQAFNRLLAQLDPQSQLNLMQVTEMTPATAMILAEKVSRGEFVAIAGDRIPVSPSPRVARASFLGETAAFPVGPYVLASLLQCPVYLLFSLTKNGRSECHFELFREVVQLPRKNRDQILDELAAAYAARLEHFCLKAPLQWFNFYDFWHLSGYQDASR